MLFLCYTIRYGFRNIYITHTDAKKVLNINSQEAVNEEEIYNQYKDKKDLELLEALGLKTDIFNVDDNSYREIFFSNVKGESDSKPQIISISNLVLRCDSITETTKKVETPVVEETPVETPKKKTTRKKSVKKEA